MNQKSKVAIIVAIIGAVGAVGGGSYVLDFSNNTTTTDNSNIDNSQTIIHEGDTIINEIVDEVFNPDGVIETDELFDLGYDYYCEEVDPDSPECDEYWEEWE